MREPNNSIHIRLFDEFIVDATLGTLPEYSFIEPRYFEDFDSQYFPANDQHPAHDVAQGELLIKEVYETLRSSPLWTETMLVITYDEHGGFYDHVPTPTHGVPNPDGINSVDPPFDFTRLGVRIPAIVVSPWINKGTVEHKCVNGPTSHSHYDHTSIMATVKKMFDLPNFLTKRDAWACTFEWIVEQRDEPRTDCPLTIPAPPSSRPQGHRKIGDPSLNDLQLTFMNVVSLMTFFFNETATTESEAAKF